VSGKIPAKVLCFRQLASRNQFSLEKAFSAENRTGFYFFLRYRTLRARGKSMSNSPFSPLKQAFPSGNSFQAESYQTQKTFNAN
jgi:hypothetical protein